MNELVWDSNNTRVADREFFVGRVRGGRLEIVTDHKTGNFVGVHLRVEKPVNTPPEYSATTLLYEATT